MVDLQTVGYGFIGLGIVFLILEAIMPGFFVAVPGTIAIILGVFAFIVPDDALFWRWVLPITAVTAIPATAVSIWAYRKMAPPATVPTTMTSDRLLGEVALVTRTVEPDNSKGKVKLRGQIWSATADSVIPDGTRVRVTRAEGVVLQVEPVQA